MIIKISMRIEEVMPTVKILLISFLMRSSKTKVEYIMKHTQKVLQEKKEEKIFKKKYQ